MVRAAVLSLLVLGSACRDDGGSGMSAPDAPSGEQPDALPGALSTTCTGACQTTAITAAMSATRTLDHAVYGINLTNTLHVEIHEGGVTGCPTMSSPTPDYTLVLSAVPVPTSTAAASTPANILDFKGDLLGGALGKPATSASAAAVAYKPGDFVALDITVAFSPGMATGHLYATHCASLDEN